MRLTITLVLISIGTFLSFTGTAQVISSAEHYTINQQNSDNESKGLHSRYLSSDEFSVGPIRKLKWPPPSVTTGSLLIGYGITAQFSPLVKSWDTGIRTEVRSRVNRLYRIDDFIQYSPISAVFFLDIVGVPAKHSANERIFVSLSSGIVAAALSHGSKYMIDVKRPDSWAQNSFPSAHTSLAFWGAHILYREYRDVSPWIGISAYIVAGAVGSLRIVNDRHWFSDVMAGAGIGILSVELGYLLLKPAKKILR